MMKTTLLAAMAATTQAADAACATATTGDKLVCVAPLRTTISDDKIDYEGEKLNGTQGDGYRGRQNKTNEDKDCMAWNVQDPMKHTFTTKEYPQSGLEGNFCRNPDGKKTGIWCFLAEADAGNEDGWDFCAPLQKPTCKGTEDCYDKGFTGCCQEMTVTSDYKATADTQKFGMIASKIFYPAEAGSKYTTCMSTEYVAEYEGKLAEGKTVKGTLGGDYFAKMVKADKGMVFKQKFDSIEALYSALDTDKPTMDALTVEMTCLVSEAGKKVADAKAKEEAAKKAEEDKKAEADDAIMIGTSASVAFVAAALF